MSSENNDNDNINWPTAVLYMFLAVVLVFLCYGDKILDAITK